MSQKITEAITQKFENEKSEMSKFFVFPSQSSWYLTERFLNFKNLSGFLFQGGVGGEHSKADIVPPPLFE